MATGKFDPSALDKTPLDEDQGALDAWLTERDEHLLLGRLMSRRMALADQIIEANRDLVKLAARGLANSEDGESLRSKLATLQGQHDDVVAEITEALNQLPEPLKDAPIPEASEGKTNGSGLVRLRHPNRDFFIADLFGYALKDDMGSMEAPIFSLSTKPDLSIWTWQNKEGSKYVKVVPSVLGRATQHDKDVLIYLISQFNEGQKRGREDTQNKTIRFTVHDFLVTTNRQTGGEAYKRLHEAFERLRGTSITTNIMTGGERTREGFGIIDKWKIIEKSKTDERMISVEVTLSDWLYNAIQAFEILTIHPDYFRLRSPLARRLYEIARKYCGRQAKITVSLARLQQNMGSKSTLKEFRRAIRVIQAHDSLPEYRISLSAADDVVFNPKDPKRLVKGLAARIATTEAWEK